MNPTFDLYDLRRDNLPDMLRKLFIMEPVEILARTDNDAEGEANSDSEVIRLPFNDRETIRQKS